MTGAILQHSAVSFSDAEPHSQETQEMSMLVGAITGASVPKSSLGDNHVHKYISRTVQSTL